VINTPDMDGVRCWPSDPHPILVEFMRDSATTAGETLEISKNGKTLKLTYTVVDDKRKFSISRNPRPCPLPKRP